MAKIIQHGTWDLHPADEGRGAPLDEEVAQEAHALPPVVVRRAGADLLC